MRKEADRFRLPNLFEWHSGDIVLFSGFVRGKDVVGRSIEKAQRLRLDQSLEHARWVHDFVYHAYQLNKPSPRLLSQSPLLEDVPVRWHEASEHLEPAYV